MHLSPPSRLPPGEIQFVNALIVGPRNERSGLLPFQSPQYNPETSLLLLSPSCSPVKTRTLKLTLSPPEICSCLAVHGLPALLAPFPSIRAFPVPLVLDQDFFKRTYKLHFPSSSFLPVSPLRYTSSSRHPLGTFFGGVKSTTHFGHPPGLLVYFCGRVSPAVPPATLKAPCETGLLMHRYNELSPRVFFHFSVSVP